MEVSIYPYLKPCISGVGLIDHIKRLTMNKYNVGAQTRFKKSALKSPIRMKSLSSPKFNSDMKFRSV